MKRRQSAVSSRQSTEKTGKVTNIVFYGIGGQGVLKASEVCAWAALFESYHVKKTEVHGMAQRGGSVESHVRFGKTVFSPMAPFGKVDFLVCLHPEEYDRLKDILKPGGVDLIAYAKKGEELLKDNKFYLNTFLLGVLSHYLPLKEENWLKAIELIFKSKRLEENKKIFFEGRKIGGTL